MTRKHNIVVVGNGLFGSMAATFAREAGHTVTVVADARPYRASPASGCVLAPSWLSAVPKEDIANGMAALDAHYGLEPILFDTAVGGFKAHRVVTDKVLLKPDVVDVVTEVGPGVVRTSSRALRGKVLVAAGIWCSELLRDLPAMRGLYGASLRVPGQLQHPRLSVYAPYRQAVAFNINRKEVWFGDGTALIEKTWMKEADARLQATRKRAAGLGILHTHTSYPKVLIGARPYMAGHMGYFAKVDKDLWVSTGGAKNGTLLAALQATQFLKELS